MARSRLVLLVVGALALFLEAGAAAAQGASAPARPADAPDAKPAARSAPRQLAIANKPWTGDFDRMLQRRMIRVLVPYSRTLYYSDRGHERGMTAELVRAWERDINQRHAKRLGKRPVTVYMIPTTRDRLISGVAEGYGDVAAGNITVTDTRQELVDFVAPTDVRAVNEIVVAGPKAPAIASVEDLAGRTVHARKTTSYHESLVALNERFTAEGKPPVTVVPLPDALEDEDMLDLVNAGLLDLVVVDDWLARVWAPLLTNIRVVPDAALRTGGRIGWAIRKESPALRAALEAYYAAVVRKQNLIPVLESQARARVRRLRNNMEDSEYRRFEETIEIFRKYGVRYNFDPLMLAAQGYQESTLDQTARSHVGAIGVMQVMPATGAQLKVGDIRVTEPNIHAGVKYMDQLMTRYFPDANFSEGNRQLFAFASYNAGPGNISRMRKLAGQRGLDPDKWFNNVEVVTAERIGVETTTYVRNIYKYFVTYKLTVEQMEVQRAVKEQIKQGR
jgi:membrane-bound lytic murein transglycosylase MltF